MTNLVDEVNKVIKSGKDVTKEMNGRLYRQMYDPGYIRFGSFNAKTNKVSCVHYEADGDLSFENFKLDDELKRFERINKAEILQGQPQTHITKNSNWAVDIGD